MMLLFRACDWLRHKARLRKWNRAQAWGRRGEDLAHRYLQRHGYAVVARNFTLKPLKAELDIVARAGETIVFVEVKTRATDAFGLPEEAVDQEKREQIVRAAGAYLRAADATWEQARFDIISVFFAQSPRVDHLRDAFRPDFSR